MRKQIPQDVRSLAGDATGPRHSGAGSDIPPGKRTRAIGSVSPTAADFMRKRLSLRHLRLLLAIERAHTITGAAAILEVSQVAVSKTLSELEAGLGVKLFDRCRSGLVPSEFCLRMLDASRRIDREIDCLGEEFLMARGGFSGRVRIGLQSQSALPFLSRAIADFKEAYPLTTISLAAGTQDEHATELARGRLDFVIGPPTMIDPQFELLSEAIPAERPVVVKGPRGEPLKGSLAWRDLMDHVWCLPPEGRILRVHFDHILAHEGLSLPAKLVEMPPTFLAESVIRASGFLAMVPSSIGECWAQRGGIQLVDVDVPPLSDSMRLIWSAPGPMTPAARMFLSFVREEIVSEEADAA